MKIYNYVFFFRAIFSAEHGMVCAHKDRVNFMTTSFFNSHDIKLHSQKNNIYI